MYIRDGQMGEVVCLSQMTDKQGKEKQLEEALQALVQQTKLEKGCVAYEIWRDTELSQSFVVYERFCSQKDLEDHVNTSYVQKFVSNEYVSCVESHWDMTFDPM